MMKNRSMRRSRRLRQQPQGNRVQPLRRSQVRQMTTRLQPILKQPQHRLFQLKMPPLPRNLNLPSRQKMERICPTMQSPRQMNYCKPSSVITFTTMMARICLEGLPTTTFGSGGGVD
jgi:hypothetical protein